LTTSVLSTIIRPELLFPGRAELEDNNQTQFSVHHGNVQLQVLQQSIPWQESVFGGTLDLVFLHFQIATPVVSDPIMLDQATGLIERTSPAAYLLRVIFRHKSSGCEINWKPVKLVTQPQRGEKTQNNFQCHQFAIISYWNVPPSKSGNISSILQKMSQAIGVLIVRQRPYQGEGANYFPANGS